MTTSIPAPKTLNINIGDTINSGGQTYTITNVSSADNGAGFVIYTLTLSNGATLNGISYANTVISSKNVPVDPAVRDWVQSIAA